MPASRKAQEAINAKRLVDDRPQAGEIFAEGVAPGKDYVWSEYHDCEGAECKNTAQAKVDLSKENQLWHYLHPHSTDTKDRYTEDPDKPQHNPKSSFLNSIPKPPPPPKPQRVPSHSAARPSHVTASGVVKPERPYVYKPKKPVDASGLTPFAPQKFALNTAGPSGIPPLSFGTDPRFSNPGTFTAGRLTPLPNHTQPQQQFQGGFHSPFAHGPPVPIARAPSQSINPAWLSQPPQQMPQQMPAPSAYQSFQRAPSQPPNPTISTAVAPPSVGAHNQPSTSYNTPSQQGVAPPAAPQPPATAVPQHAWQKFSFFQAYHNR